MWQHSLSDCSPHTHGNFAGCDCRPWLGAEATRCSKHGREYLLAWQLFSLLLFNLVNVAGCSSLLKVPCNCSRWVEPTLPTHPKQGEKKDSIPYCSQLKKKHSKTCRHYQSRSAGVILCCDQQEQDEWSGQNLRLLGAHAKVSEKPEYSIIHER